MTDTERLRELSSCLRSDLVQVSDPAFMRRIADLLEAVPPEVLKALGDGTWQAVPVEPTFSIQDAVRRAAYEDDMSSEAHAMALKIWECVIRIARSAAAPEKPE